MFADSISHYQNNTSKELNPKAIFFDMDGVLFDSMPYHATAWVNAMTDIGIPFTEHEAYMNEGRTGHSTIDGAFNREWNRNATEDEKQQIYKIKSKYFEAYPPSPVMPFSAELLSKIKAQGLRIFLVTGSGQPSLLDRLQVFFPDVFAPENMVTAFDVKHGKPHPEPYLMALEKAGLEAHEAVVVENAPLGVESATTAGIYTIAVNTGPLDDKVLTNSGAALVFDSMKDLFDNWETFINQFKS